MKANLASHCVPVEMLDGAVPGYEDFLDQRRRLMAAKLKKYFEQL